MVNDAEETDVPGRVANLGRDLMDAIFEVVQRDLLKHVSNTQSGLGTKNLPAGFCVRHTCLGRHHECNLGLSCERRRLLV
jgi:hypothetical protein